MRDKDKLGDKLDDLFTIDLFTFLPNPIYMTF